MTDRLGLRLADLATRINDKLSLFEARLVRAEASPSFNIVIGTTPPADKTALWLDTN